MEDVAAAVEAAAEAVEVEAVATVVSEEAEATETEKGAEARVGVAPTRNMEYLEVP